jgi:hypothetical protein
MKNKIILTFTFRNIYIYMFCSFLKKKKIYIISHFQVIIEYIIKIKVNGITIVLGKIKKKKKALAFEGTFLYKQL